ncbi:MAG TPA: GNAT family N-acetyltransferase [candidate division Zixibacteria bacterium]|nr:GNAT family N-acetyltransferase [candidate division Zixibacteria bacterium]HEQ98430.1 GNAT family N-acetyltransferase [candidate division Zixibacteria bacterium]
MKGVKLRIRPATAGDYDAVANLLNRIFPPVDIEKRKRLWRWRHELNPARNSKIPPFLVAEKNERIAGVHGLVPMLFKVGNNTLTVVCSCDYAVQPDARSAGMKLKLAAFSKEISPLHLSTSANRAANKITLALGGKELETGKLKLLNVLKYHRLIYSKLKGKTGGGIARFLGTIMGGPLNLYSGLRGHTGKLEIDPAYKLEPVSAFDQKHDDFWNGISADYDICVIRDSRYLNWRYIQYPFGKIQCRELLRDENVKGILAVHHSIDEDGLRFTAVLETLVSRNDNKSLNILLQQAVKAAVQNGSHYITSAPHDPQNLEYYRKIGFRIKTAEYSPFTYKNNSPIGENFLADERRWYFSLGDGDICYYFE